MSELVFATVIAELKTSWAESISDPEMIELLYDAVALPTGLVNQNGDTITVPKGTASKVVNREVGGNVRQDIRANSSDQRVLDSIEDYFKKEVVAKLLKGGEDDLIHRLKTIINNDDEIAGDKKNELLALADKKTLAKFLASVYLYSLSRKNVPSGGKTKAAQTESEKEESKKHPLPKMTIPVRIGNKERGYIDALMDVYAESTGEQDFKIKTLDTYPDVKQHFIRQRNDYFAAEAVRRGTRDVYGDNEEEYFQILLDEIYNGIIDVYESRKHKTGFERLEAVLIEAKGTPVDQCWLSRDTVWIGNSQKKGVCHILINENVLKGWVRNDAASI